MKCLMLFGLLAYSFSVYSLNPSLTYKQRPEKYNMIYEEHKVPTQDGAVLNAWYFPAVTKTTELVLISHNGEGNMAEYLRRIDQFLSAGYNVVIYDYRGFGESSSFEIDNNMFIYPHFQTDMETMIEFCSKQFEPSFSLYGWGVGAGLSLGIGGNRQEINFIIADTPFFSMEDLEERFSSWDEPMEVPFAGYEKRFEPFYTLENALAKNIKGILLIIGSNDILYTVDDMNTLRNKQKKLIKEVYVVENPNRIDNFKVDKKAYFDVIKSFLGK